MELDYANYIIERVIELADSKGISIPPVRIQWDCCRLEEDHKKKPRNLAHIEAEQNPNDRFVCLHPDLMDKDADIIAGIVVHELGHIMTPVDESMGQEPVADEFIRQKLGLDILYDTTTTLEYLSEKDMKLLNA